jgi:hypothetical protein
MLCGVPIDTTPMANIADRPLMIMAGMEINRKSIPYGRAFLPSEGEWMFGFFNGCGVTPDLWN